MKYNEVGAHLKDNYLFILFVKNKKKCKQGHQNPFHSPKLKSIHCFPIVCLFKIFKRTLKGIHFSFIL